MRILRSALVLSFLLLSTTSWATTPYAIDLKVTNSQSYNSIDLRITYSAANGGFAGSGSTVSCTTNASLNASASYNDQESISRLNTAIMRDAVMAGPAVLFTCTFDSNGGAPSASNFVISVYDWSSSSTTTPPTVQISRIEAL